VIAVAVALGAGRLVSDRAPAPEWYHEGLADPGLDGPIAPLDFAY
jgi:hypothetical protein